MHIRFDVCEVVHTPACMCGLPALGVWWYACIGVRCTDLSTRMDCRMHVCVQMAACMPGGIAGVVPSILPVGAAWWCRSIGRAACMPAIVHDLHWMKMNVANPHAHMHDWASMCIDDDKSACMRGWMKQHVYACMCLCECLGMSV